MDILFLIKDRAWGQAQNSFLVNAQSSTPLTEKMQLQLCLHLAAIQR